MSDDPSPAARPVAVVVVDSGLAHLDHPFEYAVPPELDTVAVPGVRVRVRFAGRDVDGFVVERRAIAEHPGRLTALRRVVSPEPVLTQRLLVTARAVADHYGGTLSDVLRLAVPKRHAAAERALDAAPTEPSDANPEVPQPGPWAAYPAGEAFLRRLVEGQTPAASWLALPTRRPEEDWPRALAVAAGTALAAGRGALLVVPDHRDVARVDAELTGLLGPGRHVRLTADQGPQARYTAWLKVLRGRVRCVVGTRTAAFAPVRDLGLVAWWDDGDDLLAEPRAPYPQVRTVLALRAAQEGAAMLAGGFARSVPLARWVAAGRMVDLRAAPATVRAAAPAVRIAGEGPARAGDSAAARAQVPPSVWRLAHEALNRGPVLVQVPRSGYRPALSCQTCRTPLRCPQCHGPVGQGDARSAPACLWCGAQLAGGAGFRCPECAGTTWRSVVLGARRTAEELGRAFPGRTVVVSGEGQVSPAVTDDPALVIATPGAEPVARGGYAACLLLDAWAPLGRPELDASIEAWRRWAAASALTRPSAEGGVVVLAGVPDGPPIPAVEALVRWDPAWLAERELLERVELGLPPAVVLAEVVGARRAAATAAAELAGAVRAELAAARPSTAEPAPDAVAVFGPLPLPARPEVAEVRMLVRVPRSSAGALSRAVAAARSVRSARKDPEPVTVKVGWAG